MHSPRIEGKEDFYKKVEQALKSIGYQYYGEKDISGIGRAHASKPDYIAIKGSVIIIGEIKSPKEGPTSGIWRQAQPNDSNEFKAVRQDVVKKEGTEKLSKNVGGHEIIIRGQIPDYVKKLGKTYHPPSPIKKYEKIIGGYSVPINESANVELAFDNSGFNITKKIDVGNGTVTYLFNC